MAYIRVDVDLDEFDDDDLINEVEMRGFTVLDDDEVDEKIDLYTIELITNVYESRRCGKDYQRPLDELIHRMIGRIS